MKTSLQLTPLFLVLAVIIGYCYATFFTPTQGELVRDSCIKQAITNNTLTKDKHTYCENLKEIDEESTP